MNRFDVLFWCWCGFLGLVCVVMFWLLLGVVLVSYDKVFGVV